MTRGTGRYGTAPVWTILFPMEFNRRNYYRLLNVQSDAAPNVIKAAYRALIAEHHPDRGGDPAMATLLNEAYAVLSTPSRRTAYDAARAAKGGEYKPADARAQAQQKSQAGGTSRRRSGEHARVTSCHMCGFGSRGLPADDARCERCASPLSAVPISKGADGTAERRALPRVNRTNRARLVTHWQDAAVDVQLRDLSRDGMSFQCGDALAATSRIRLTCDAFDVVGEVVWSRRMPTGAFIIHARMVTAIFAVKTGGFVSALA